MAESFLHPIQVVVERTGLSAHVIRIWEKRYRAVAPQRTDTNRRLYSDEQIERLRLLGRLAGTGHGIGYVARLPTEKLRNLIEDTPAAVPPGRQHASPSEAATLLPDAMAAVERMDAEALNALLDRAATQLGGQGVLQRLVAPLAQAIGEQWRAGAITAAHEHFASAVLRLFLGHAAKPFAAAQHAPALVVATPAGQLHELGALLAGATAANLGWHVVYLGASLGAAEIAGAATQNRARAVALSLVYPEDDPQLPAELTRLRALLPDTALVAGGRAMPAYAESLDAIRAIRTQDLAQLGSILDRLRSPAGPRLAREERQPAPPERPKSLT